MPVEEVEEGEQVEGELRPALASSAREFVSVENRRRVVEVPRAFRRALQNPAHGERE